MLDVIRAYERSMNHTRTHRTRHKTFAYSKRCARERGLNKILKETRAEFRRWNKSLETRGILYTAATHS